MLKPRAIKTIRYSAGFERVYKKLPKEEKSIAEKRESIFRNNIFDPCLKTHKLKGKLKNYWSFSVTYSNRILFKFLKNDEIMFYDIGDHKIYQ